MRLSISQPQFFPWLGYYERIYNSDLHVQLDHVQYEKNSLINRNRIISNGRSHFLTVPCKTSGKFQDLSINLVEIDCTRPWANKMLSTLRHSYSKAPFFAQIYPKLEYLLLSETTSLIQLLSSSLEYTSQTLRIDTPVLSSSSMALSSRKSDLVLEICLKFRATEYLSGPFGRHYLNLSSFKKHNIKVLFHDYQPYPYAQYNQKEPITGLSVLDYLFNHYPQSISELPICLDYPH